MRVYIFTGKNPVYGFTQDKNGGNLPPEYGPWVPRNEIEMQRGEPPRIAVNTDEALDNIQAHGFHLQGVDFRYSEGA